MKIAGRKNDGAWYRTNKVIQGLTPDEVSALAALILIEDVIVHDAYETMNDFYLAAGIIADEPNQSATKETWVHQMASVGIPRQVWMGRLSFDTYTRTGAPGSYVYTPDHQLAFHVFGKYIRKTCKNFVFARRAALDLNNLVSRPNGNPGGIANAEPGD